MIFTEISFFVGDDSNFEVDLLLSCKVVQIQIDSLDGRESNIQIPGQGVAAIRQEARMTSMSSGDTSQCVRCGKRERELACIPCGHVTICVPCSQFLRNCLWCRQDIHAFIRAYH